jgi:DNA-binding winged helix-turn-helix (wHTH) protein
MNTQTTRDALVGYAEETFVGRTEELAILSKALLGAVPPVTFVHGIGGIGKSRLLEAFALQARSHAATVIRIDCRQVEPAPSRFLSELGAAIGGEFVSVDEACQRLGPLERRVILILDNYEVLRLLDTWLRHNFVPVLPGNVHVILSGRDAPLAAWLCTPGWGGLFRSLALEALSEADAVELLVRAGIPADRAQRINRFTRGHPMALTLAATALTQDLADLEHLTLHRVIEELAHIYLAEVSDEVTRRALEAAAVVRCATVSLLRAMLPEAAPQDVYERLRTLPVVKTYRDGLRVHDCLQQSIAATVKSGDPTRYLSFRRAAWHQLRAEVRSAPSGDLWRYTADMLYLLENPVIREAFFPTGAQVYAVEPARPQDGSAILCIAGNHDTPEAVRSLECWWTEAPQTFSVAKDVYGEIVGFYCMFDPETIPNDLGHRDPVVANWLEHLEANPVPATQCALFLRRWLSSEGGESPSAIQAACWLDIKGTYMRLRPDLRRVYLTLRDPAPYAPVARQLGFRMIPKADAVLDGISYSTAMIDFGPSSVDGWLAGLVAAELGIDSEELIDVEGRQLVIEGRRVALTPLEFSVMHYLHEREGKAVNREWLLRDVWGHKYDVGSNVVDVVVRGLRKKLGDRANMIETVPGFGYRFRHQSRLTTVASGAQESHNNINQPRR